MSDDDDFWGEPIKQPTAATNAVNGSTVDRVQREVAEATAALEEQEVASADASTNVSVNESETASSASTSSSDPFYSDSESSADSDGLPTNDAALDGSLSTSPEEEPQAEPFRFTPHSSPETPHPVKSRRPTPSPAKRKVVDRYVVKDSANTLTHGSSKPLRRQREPSTRSADADLLAKSSKTTTATLLPIGRSNAPVSSARSSALADRVHYLERKLNEALTLNRTLESIQKRQDAALARAEKGRLALGNQGLPLVDRHLEEVRVLKEQVRLQRHKLREQERLLAKRNAAMQRINDKAKKLETVLKDREISPRRKLKKSRPPTAVIQSELEEKNKRVQDLQKQVRLLEKNHRHAFGIEVSRHKETQKRLQDLEDELARVRRQHALVAHKRPIANESGSTAMVVEASSQKKSTQRRSESESKPRTTKNTTNNSRAIRPVDLSSSQPVVSAKPAKVKSKAPAVSPRKKSKSRLVRRAASIADEAPAVEDETTSSDAPSPPHPAVVRATKSNNSLELNLAKSQKANSYHALASRTATNDDGDALLANLTFRRNSLNRERTFALTNGHVPSLVSQAAQQSSLKMKQSESRYRSKTQQPPTIASKTTESDPFAGLKPARVTRNASQNSSKSQPTQTASRNSLIEELFGPKRQTKSAELRPKKLTDLKDEDLFPELKQKQRTSTISVSPARGNIGLFPWETNRTTAAVPASEKRYDIVQF